MRRLPQAQLAQSHDAGPLVLPDVRKRTTPGSPCRHSLVADKVTVLGKVVVAKVRWVNQPRVAPPGVRAIVDPGTEGAEQESAGQASAARATLGSESSQLFARFHFSVPLLIARE